MFREKYQRYTHEQRVEGTKWGIRNRNLKTIQWPKVKEKSTKHYTEN